MKSIGEVVAAEGGGTRGPVPCATPSCPNEVPVQTLFLGTWTPDVCAECYKAQRTEEDEGALYRRMEAEASARLDALGTPAQYGEASLSSLVEYGSQENVRRIRRLRAILTRYVERWKVRRSREFPHVLVLHGPPGTGKTLSGWIVAREIARRYEPGEGGNVVVARAKDAALDVRESWSGATAEDTKGRTTERKRLSIYRNADLLVLDRVTLDDIGDATMLRHIRDMVIPREEEWRPTIILSGARTSSEIGTMLGATVVSAAWDGESMIDTTGEDYRVWSRAER